MESLLTWLFLFVNFALSILSYHLGYTAMHPNHGESVLGDLSRLP